jgi:hypothetical protein
VTFESIVLITANVVAGFFNVWLARSELSTLLYDRDNQKLTTFTAVMLPYFAITEFLPSIVIASTILKFSKIISGMNEMQRGEEAVANLVAQMRQNGDNPPP